MKINRIKYQSILRNVTEAIAVLEYSRQNILKNTKVDELGRRLKYDKSIASQRIASDGTATNLTSDELVQQFLDILEEIDTSPNKKYVPIMFKLYAAGGSRAIIEDLPNTVIGSLKTMEEAKRLNILEDPAHLDGYRYKDVEQLENMGYYYADKVKAELDVRGKTKVNRKVQGNFEMLGETPDVYVVRPLDYAASAHWGKHTSWCTANSPDAQYSGARAFKDYSCKGPLIIIYPKDERLSKHNANYLRHEKYQLNIRTTDNSTGTDSDDVPMQSIEFKDEMDKDVAFLTIIKKFPGVEDILLNYEDGGNIATLIKADLNNTTEAELIEMTKEIRDETKVYLDTIIANPRLTLKEMFTYNGTPIPLKEVRDAFKLAIAKEQDENITVTELMNVKAARQYSVAMTRAVSEKYANILLRTVYRHLKSIYGAGLKINNTTTRQDDKFLETWIKTFRQQFPATYSKSKQRYTIKFVK